MLDRYHEELRRQQEQQRKLEELMQRNKENQRDEQLKIQLQWFNKQ